MKNKIFKLHEGGKISIKNKVSIKNKEDLALVYTPGVAEVCKEIEKNKEKVYDYTSKKNNIAIITDGTAVLGLGDIGPEAAIPVMEGKANLFKEFANIDAFPVCLNEKNKDKIIEIIKSLEPFFGGINLEDISAPRCFEIEEKLKKILNIPVFHDDQHGTAIVVLAGLINSLKIVSKKIDNVRIVVNGAGAAGIAITKLLLSYGAQNILVCDSQGVISKDRKLEGIKKEMCSLTNKNNEKGNLGDIIKKADVFIGVSRGNVLTREMVENMNENPIVFALANPTPEISPEEAKKAGAKIIATGRSDFPNQINNALVFPGLFRGVLDSKAKEINEEMKIAASFALKDIVGNNLNEEFILPDVFNKEVVEKISKAVYDKAIETGVARI
jgi:malate dehydrogenase (oxaloacetate-decarboxylating)